MALRRVRIQRIVCPTDFSEFAERALRRGVSLARWFDAQVIALHVIPAVPWAAPGAGWAAGILVPQDLLRPVREEVAGKLEDFVRPLRGQGIALETRLGEGDVAREIQRIPIQDPDAAAAGDISGQQPAQAVYIEKVIIETT